MERGSNLDRYRRWRRTHLDGPSLFFVVGGLVALLCAFLIPNEISLLARFRAERSFLLFGPEIDVLFSVVEIFIRMALVVPFSLCVAAVLARAFPRPAPTPDGGIMQGLLSLSWLMVMVLWIGALAVKWFIVDESNYGFLVIWPVELALAGLALTRMTPQHKVRHSVLFLRRFGRQAPSPFLSASSCIPGAALLVSTVPGFVKWDTVGHLLDTILTVFQIPPKLGATYYASSNEDWHYGVLALARQARVVVIDLSEHSAAVEEEVVMVVGNEVSLDRIVFVADRARFALATWPAYVQQLLALRQPVSCDFERRPMGPAEWLLLLYTIDLGTLFLNRLALAFAAGRPSAGIEAGIVAVGVLALVSILLRARWTRWLTPDSESRLATALEVASRPG